MDNEINWSTRLSKGTAAAHMHLSINGIES